MMVLRQPEQAAVGHIASLLSDGVVGVIWSETVERE